MTDLNGQNMKKSLPEYYKKKSKGDCKWKQRNNRHVKCDRDLKIKQ